MRWLLGLSALALVAIEAAIGVLSTYNAAHPAKPVVGKLRVWSGPNAPAWVIALSGGAVTVQGHVNPIQIARYWTTAYNGAWVKLQKQLGAA